MMGSGEIELAYDLQRRPQLAFATVDDDKVGHGPFVLQGLLCLHIFAGDGGFGLLTTGTPAEAAAQHLLMAGEIVWPLDRLDFETAIFAIFGASRLKHDHRAYRVGTRGVGDVVAFDAIRWSGQVEGCLNLF